MRNLAKVMLGGIVHDIELVNESTFRPRMVDETRTELDRLTTIVTSIS
jgi:hypothetical protein